MGYNLLINGVYKGYNPLTNLLLTSWDIQECELFDDTIDGRNPKQPLEMYKIIKPCKKW